MQINRLLEMICLLLDHKKMTAGELAAHFEVSARTIYRDVEVLSQAGIPVYAVKGTGGGITLTENYVLNKMLLTPEEQKNILQSLYGMNAMRIDGVQPVMEKLSALFGGAPQNWIEIDFGVWNPDRPVSKYFPLLKEAILARNVVTFSYCGASGTAQLRTVEPVRLVFRGYDWYLLAWCKMREAGRFFKLSRMAQLTVTRTHFARRKLDACPPPQTQYAQKMVTVTAQISSTMEHRVREEFYLPEDCRLADGSFLVEFEMPDNTWLYDYLLSFGPAIKVMEPLSVQQELVRRITSALHQYQDAAAND